MNSRDYPFFFSFLLFFFPRKSKFPPLAPEKPRDGRKRQHIITYITDPSQNSGVPPFLDPSRSSPREQDPPTTYTHQTGPHLMHCPWLALACLYPSSFLPVSVRLSPFCHIRFPPFSRCEINRLMAVLFSQPLKGSTYI